MTEKIRPIITADESVTFYNAKFNECYHTKAGAIKEAEIKHVQPCNPGSFDKVRILDVCFGLGYNSLMAINAAGNAKIHITALENDIGIIRKILSLNLGLHAFQYIKGLAETALNSKQNYVEYKKDNVEIHLFLGDAKQTIDKVCGDYDCVFFDPFSPKNCPELWTQYFFRKIYEKCNRCCTLTTFSCAKWVRENMKAAGFKVKDGPVFGRKAPGTVAYLDESFID